MTPATERQRHQSKIAIESAIVRRVCPVCGQLTKVEIVEMADGWERWLCKANGCEKQYRTR